MAADLLTGWPLQRVCTVCSPLFPVTGMSLYWPSCTANLALGSAFHTQPETYKRLEKYLAHGKRQNH